jgi:hypothetical protein
MPQNAGTDRIFVRFIAHRYDDSCAWLGTESTDGKVLPCAADSFFRLDLKKGLEWADAVWARDPALLGHFAGHFAHSAPNCSSGL